MTKANTAWFHCFSGIAGDMALGALIDAGADLEAVKKVCSQLNLPDWKLTAAPTMRNGIAATKIQVIYDENSPAHKKGRKAKEILELIASAELPERVRQRSLAAFEALAKAEGKLHQKPAEEIHFHEVGGVDAIVDIVGVMAALEVLDIDSICSSSVAQGTGTIKCEHGEMPNPPPAVTELLRGVKTHGVDVPFELTTPTGAALLKTLVVAGETAEETKEKAFGPIPEMEVTASGFGAGDREFPQLPNLTQVIIGKAAPPATSAAPAVLGSSKTGQPAVLLETNLDDITGEALADSIQRLLDAGAHDVWASPIIMKKGRPAHTLSVLADTADVPALADLMIKTTGTFGIRSQQLTRFPQPRVTEVIEVKGHKIRIKVMKTAAEKGKEPSPSQAKAEYEDLKAAAEATGMTLAEMEALAKNKAKEAVKELKVKENKTETEKRSKK